MMNIINMKTSAIQYSVVAFVVISLIISIFYADSLQKSKKKHMLAGCFVLGAAFIHLLMIILELKSPM